MTRKEALKFRANIANAAKTQTDEDALESVWMYDSWDGNRIYEVGDRVRDMDKLYKRIQPWTAPEVYPPHEVPALWVEVAPPGEYREIKENPLPTEVFALNEIGWWQTKDNLYKSLINANSYTPVSYPAGWEKL